MSIFLKIMNRISTSLIIFPKNIVTKKAPSGLALNINPTISSDISFFAANGGKKGVTNDKEKPKIS